MFSKYCTSTVHGYLTNGPYRVQARAKKTHKKNNNPNGASCKHPMYSPTLAHRKEVRKGLEIKHKSTGVLEIFLSQLLKCKSLSQDMNFTYLLLSCCLASLPETITLFYFTLIFQEENLLRGNAGCLGCLRHRVRSQNTPTALEAAGRGQSSPPTPFCSNIRETTAFNR